MTEQARRDRLIKWLETIYSEVRRLLMNDHIFWKLQEIVQKNDNFSKASGLFTGWIAEGYIHSAVIGMRRQIKAQSGSISLKGFLLEVRQHPELVSRGHYIQLHKDVDERLTELGQRDFDKVAGQASTCIPVAVVDEQLRRLKQLVSNLESFADRRIAHYDRKEPAQPLPTFEELSGAIAYLEEIVKLYWRLLKGAGMSTMLPTIIFDWKDVFRFAWEPGEVDSAG